MPNGRNKPTVDDQLGEIRSLLMAQPAPPLGALIRVVLQKTPSRFVVGRATFSSEVLLPPRAESPGNLETLNYSKYVYLAEWVTPVRDALDRLGKLLNGKGYLCGISVPGEFNSTEHRRAVPGASFDGDPRWIEYRWENGLANRTNVGFDPSTLVEFGRPGYEDIRHLVLDRVMDKPGENRNNARSFDEQFYISLPDQRARFERVEYADGAITATIESVISAGELEVHLIDRTPMDQTKRQQVQSDSTVVFLHPAPLRAPDGGMPKLALVHRDLGLIAEAYPKEPAQADADVRSASEIAAEEVLRGESDHVECKPWISAGAADKELELLESIAAFSNAHGGRLYFGIHAKTRAPLGKAELCRRFPGKQPAEALSAARQRVLDLVQEELEPVPANHRLLELELLGEPVIVLEIPEGNHPPYVVKRTREVLIRSGSSNRLPTPVEHRELADRRNRTPTSARFTSLTGRPFWASSVW